MFEKYREAWCLLDCSRKARGWKDIPTLCRCRELSMRCAGLPEWGGRRRTLSWPFLTLEEVLDTDIA
jgi:hypothetical protein